MKKAKAKKKKLDPASKVLMSARFRLSKGLSKGAYARDINGQETEPNAQNAASWCPVGAIEAAYKCVGENDPSVHAEAIAAVALQTRCASLLAWSDDPERTQEEVLAKFDAAIAFLES